MITFSSLLSSLLQKEAVEGTSQTTPNCKRKHPSHMKASLLIQPSSGILSPLPKCFSNDDICSNHWVMSLTDIKSPTWRCRKKRRRGANSLDWWCHGEEDVWHFLLLPHFWNPVGDGRGCAAACSLWLWDNLWELRKCKNLIYSCRWRRS